ncbi:POTRA domain-containing protein [Adhaeretor mobilis]|uniref:POTRA domain-containing protein n=1 Tax=Adhaeretor mobilis TaxID=1930276 RepID=UPI001C54D736|nr:POTRA domain-containing protein [Adhaeretor mobilis]
MISPQGPAIGAAQSDPEKNVIDVRIVGNDTIETEQISGNISTRVGRPFDRSVLQRDVRRLANLGWFVDVKPLSNETPQGTIVIFEVTERPTTRYVTYLGNEKISDKKLGKQTNLKIAGSVDPFAVEEGRRKLRDFYHGQGYNNAQVTIIEGTKPTDKGVVYLINEGQSERIWKVEFIGNEFVSDGRLKTLIKSKPPLLKLFKGYVNRERIDADLEQLTAYYRAFGFFQARIGRKLDYNEKGNWVTLSFVINEGPRYKVRDVKFIGNTKFDPEKVAANTKLKAGQLFEQTDMQKDSLWLQELYGSHGYVFADVKPETIFLEKPGEVDLVYNIEEGGQFRVGRVFVHIGGDTPHSRRQIALNRLSLRPGDIMDIRELKASERRLVASGLLETDAATGVRPKITYRIPDDVEFDVATGPSADTVRGQSPTELGPPVLAPPSATYLNDFRRRVARMSPGRDDTEVHVYCKDEAHFQAWQAEEAHASDGSSGVEQPTRKVAPQEVIGAKPVFRGQDSRTQPTDTMDLLNRRVAQLRSAPGQPVHQSQHQQPNYQQVLPQQPWQPTRSQTQTVRRPTSPYQQVQTNAIRGQSPQVQQAYSQVNVQPAAAPTYALPPGGQVVQAGGHAPQQGGIQPVQYSPQLQPPAGSVAPTPLNAMGPLLGSQIFPDGRFGPLGAPYPQQTVDIFINGNETQTGRLMLGVGVNSDAGVVGNVVVDERNFDWRRVPRSFDDIRNGYAFRGDGQRFRIDASPGSEVNRYLVSFQEPYLFDRAISLGLSGSYFDRRYRNWDEQRIGGRISLGRQWVERDLSATVSYRGENVNIHDISNPNQPDLAEAAGDNSLHGFKLSVINDTRDSAFLPTQGHYIELSGEQVIGTFDYPRILAELREHWLLFERPDHSGRHVLSYSTNIGYSGTHTPIYEHFFAGGFATMRGFDFRGASPVDVANGNVEVGGHFQWLNSFQYLFPITADEMLHGVAFVDFGTVEPDVEINDFRVAPGVGLRITVPAMGPAPIALDFAFPVSEAAFDTKEVFSFSLGFSR